ncbi:hypothetical protein BLNAU_7108 [Blattamonas nauphoetae]|uniref:Uncharacterized protein n=1 Tax=Blattamonas nauphoetae TaxID=2049346 RepID=A0ABQ9Y2G6_9EUKA|nr:hypothetical protein BLNAU_7108 [Blattamonas nauphoetae]
MWELDDMFGEVSILDQARLPPNDAVCDFVGTISLLYSSPNQTISAASMRMLDLLLEWSTPEVQFALVKADLIPQLILTLNPLSLSFPDAQDIHTSFVRAISESIWLATPCGLAFREIEDHNEQQAVHETVFQQVLTPSENYIAQLCANRFSIIYSDLSTQFMRLLTRLLEMSPYYQRTMDFVLALPVVLAIPSYLTFISDEESIYNFLYILNNSQREWNTKRGEMRQMWKIVYRMLRMEGFCDDSVPKLRNDRDTYSGREVVTYSIEWNNLQGMNIPR